MRVCDCCEVRPANKRLHAKGMRMCGLCEKNYRVDEKGTFVPRTFDAFIVDCANDSINAR